MAKRLQHRGGTTAQHSTFTGAVREVTVDTDKDTLVVHDGATAGGKPLPTLSGTETLSNKTLASPVATGTVDINGNLDVDGGTIKLDGNYPIGASNVALGNEALDDASLTGGGNVAIGTGSLSSNTTGAQNTGIGRNALNDVSTGSNNTAVGYQSLSNNTTASSNTAFGYQSLCANTTGSENVAVGYNSLCANTIGVRNHSLGHQSLASNTTGSDNNAFGSYSLNANTTGSNNVAIGRNALRNNTASNNTAVGFESLNANTTGEQNTAFGFSAMSGGGGVSSYNTAIGRLALACLTLAGNTFNTAVGNTALYLTTTGTRNTALGEASLAANTTGIQNVAVGANALDANTEGYSNTALGYLSLSANTTGLQNVAVGGGAGDAITTGSYNLFVGQDAGTNATTGSTNTFVGQASGSSVTTGAKNTILGRYNGNQGGLDIRTSDNNIVLSDGDGNVRLHNKSGAHLVTSSYVELAVDTYHAIHQHDSAKNLLYLQHSGGSTPSGVLIDFDQVANDNNSQYFFSCDDSVTNRLVIWSDGDIDNHDNSYGATSDIKLKEQVTDASSQWNDIKDLRIRKFKFKSDVSEKGDSDELWRLGLVAQEAELVSPNLIKESPDTDDNNQDLGTTTKSIKYSILYMKAVKALQEAMQKIEDLEARVNTLEGN